ncbi:hypothetical protein GCM10018785_16030 [Streptomyces longispororuber]|uniref:N-acetyltransferase domain-containing protein n=1 Tax=Streptomyces longispororuber TaxID=68230 RepID=A0A918ZEG2_9ACTN|nr:hypothetical protein GCM10018785_16030 [Streptomyces longispororuber]
MIPHPAHQPPGPARLFRSGGPGTAALAEHVLATGHGTWWTDRAERPRAIAVTCGDHALLAGDPTALTPADLAPLAGRRVEAPERFLPVLAAAFDRLHPRHRMLYIHRAAGVPPRLPRGVTVRRLRPEDGPVLAAAAPATARLHASWGGPAALAASGYGWAAFRKDRVLAMACTRFTGTRYEDVACTTTPDGRRQHLSLACVQGLVADVTARGRTATWSCAGDNRAGRLLAWTAGFRLAREYVQHATGPVPVSGDPPTAPDARVDGASAGAAVGWRDSSIQPPLLRLNDRWLAAGPCAERTLEVSELAAVSAASACAPRLRARASRNLRLRS